MIREIVAVETNKYLDGNMLMKSYVLCQTDAEVRYGQYYGILTFWSRTVLLTDRLQNGGKMLIKNLKTDSSGHHMIACNVEQLERQNYSSNDSYGRKYIRSFYTHTTVNETLYLSRHRLWLENETIDNTTQAISLPLITKEGTGY